jgi:hypothetical protein
MKLYVFIQEDFQTIRTAAVGKIQASNVNLKLEVWAVVQNLT